MSLSHVLPERRVTTEEVAGAFTDLGGDPVMTASALRRLTGVRERRHAAPDECSSDLAAAAGRKALDRAGLTSLDVDVLIFAAASHDVAEPATANRVQALLGCDEARAFDVKNACNSFLDGLDVACALIERQPSLRVLITTGEVISPFIKWAATDRDEVLTLIAGLTLGDAGAAAVVTGDHPSPIAHVGHSTFRTFGRHWEASRIVAGGTMRGQDFTEAHFVSDSGLLFGLAEAHIPPVIKEVIAAQGWVPDEIDLVVPHQASIAVIRRTCDLVGIPFERCMTTGERLGNTAAASIPVALSIAHEEGRLAPSSRTLLVGGAAGFSAAAVALLGVP